MRGLPRAGPRCVQIRDGELFLTNRAQLDSKHWQDIENGRTNPTVASLVGVARALGVKLGDLFEGV